MLTPGGAEHESGGQSTSIRDASRGGDRDRRDGVHHLGDQRHASNPAAEAAGLLTLRDDHVGALLHGRHGLIDAVDLVDEQATGVVRALREIARFAEREGNRLRPLAKRELERLLVKRTASVVDDEGLVGQLTRPPDLIDDLPRGQQRRTHASDPTGLATPRQ